LSRLKEPSDVDTDFDVKARSSLIRRVRTAQNELLKSQIANAVLVERLNLDLLKWGRVPDAIRDAARPANSMMGFGPKMGLKWP
jgi:hypothetical protein